MEDVFNWEPYFDKVLKKESPKRIAKCKICDDLLFYADDSDLQKYGWHTVVDLNNNTNYFVRNTCADVGYYTKKEADAIDKVFEDKYGSSIDESTGEPFRVVPTWDEHQESIEMYSRQLKDYLTKKYPTLLETFNALTTIVECSEFDIDSIDIFGEK